MHNREPAHPSSYPRLRVLQPVISKAFELELPVGGGRGSNKRISYTNQYPSSKVFLLRTNRPDLLQFKDPRLELGGGESKDIGLRFAPCQLPGTTEILVFKNAFFANNI